MKGLERLCEWLHQLETIAIQVSTWRALSAAPFSNAEAIRACELRIGWALIEAVR